MKSRQDEPEHDVKLRATLEEFRGSARAAANRPDAFWQAQRSAVLSRVNQPRKAVSRKPAVWAAAAVVVAVVAGIWRDGPRTAPAPDFAAGYDPELLIDVENLTRTEVPLALEPAMLLVGEIEAGTGRTISAGTKLPRPAVREKPKH